MPLLLGFLLGTPLVRPMFHLLGTKIGRNVVLLTTYMSVFDLAEVGDNSAINPGVSLQTHLFEDRVIMMSYVRIGPDCTIGDRSVVLYDSEMKSGARLGNLSLLMKGETHAKDSDWEGSPAQPMLQVGVIVSKQAKSEKQLVTLPGKSSKYSSSLSGNASLRKSV